MKPQPIWLRLVFILVLGIVALAFGHLFWKTPVPKWHIVGHQKHTKGVTQVYAGPLHLQRSRWQIGALSAVKKGKVKVTILYGGQPYFKIKVLANTGLPKAAHGKTLSSPLSSAQVRKVLLPYLRQLSPGTVKFRAGNPKLKLPLLQGTKKIVKVTITPQGYPYQKLFQSFSGHAYKIWTGVLAAGLALLAMGYFFYKKRMRVLVKTMDVAGKKQVGKKLKRAFYLHLTLALTAVLVAIFHIVRQWHTMTVDMGWLSLYMMITIGISGLIGRYAAKTPKLRRYWRQFHVPYSILFFAVLSLHIMQKTHVLKFLHLTHGG